MVAAAVYLIALAADPSLEARPDGSFFINVPPGARVMVQPVDANSNPSGAPIPLATVDDVAAAMALVPTTGELEASYLRQDAASGQYATRAEVSALGEQIQGLVDAVQAIEAKEDYALPTCTTPVAPDNGDVTLFDEYTAGVSITYSCPWPWRLVGDAASTCLSTGWSHPPPTCKPGGTGEAGFPGHSCSAVYARRKALGLGLGSGPYALQLQGGGAETQVYCDMSTAITVPGVTGPKFGLTLCGKYDAQRAGPAFLDNGFLRGANGAADMASLDAFSRVERRWSSIDCRALIDGAPPAQAPMGRASRTHARLEHRRGRAGGQGAAVHARRHREAGAAVRRVALHQHPAGCAAGRQEPVRLGHRSHQGQRPGEMRPPHRVRGEAPQPQSACPPPLTSSSAA